MSRCVQRHQLKSMIQAAFNINQMDIELIIILIIVKIIIILIIIIVVVVVAVINTFKCQICQIFKCVLTITVHQHESAG